MLDRNRRIKLKPEKFQHCEEQFDLIITCEERVYDQVVECKHSPYVMENAFNEFLSPTPMVFIFNGYVFLLQILIQNLHQITHLYI